MFQAVYFTSTFPYIVLFIFFGRAVTLPGASLGLEHMFTPKVCTYFNHPHQIPPVTFTDYNAMVFESGTCKIQHNSGSKVYFKTPTEKQ